MLFRSTEVSTVIEELGGGLNGGTDKELTVYWAKVPSSHFPTAVDVLSDMIRCSKFDPDDIEKERQIIIEELNMTQDAPYQLVDFLIDELLWPDQPLGRDPAGTKETVCSLTRSDMLNHIGRQYLPNQTVISIAGNVSHAKVVDVVGKAFADWQQGKPLPWYPAQDNQESARMQIEQRNTEQAQIGRAHV